DRTQDGPAVRRQRPTQIDDLEGYPELRRYVEEQAERLDMRLGNEPSSLEQLFGGDGDGSADEGDDGSGGGDGGTGDGDGGPTPGGEGVGGDPAPEGPAGAEVGGDGRE
ncbi:hypothetical protein PM035_17170, partial [Halorubrum ezzemoulense]|nr:hypothetical protein [Halorubrum ezzemoulense]